MKYAVYVRVSTDKDEQVVSIENQIDICRYWIEQNGFEWDENAVYKDEAVSGTAWLERHAMQRILKKAEARELDIVIFKSIHRLARDLKDALEIKEILLGHGIRLVTIEEGYDSLYEGKNDMKFDIYAMFASQLPRTLSVSISAALAAKVRRGEHTGKVPFGYDSVDNKMVINEEEAEVVQTIFDLYEKGLGYSAIADYLTEQGFRTRRGVKWSKMSVRYALNNRMYRGDYVMNQYTKVKVAGRKKQMLNPKEKWTIFENHHPAIISKAQWDRVNDGWESRKRKRKVSTRNELRGLVYCPHCGGRIRVITASRVRNGKRDEWRYMKCQNYKNYALIECVNHVPILYSDFREIIVNRLKEVEKEIDTAFEWKQVDRNKKDIAKTKQEIARLKNKKERLLDLYIDKLIDKDTFAKRDKDFENMLEEKESKLLKLTDESVEKDNQQQIKEAFSILNENTDLHEAFKLLIHRIWLYQDGQIKIEYTFQV
ncbi:recombinase family protein [Bacillus pseudomycoides]|uniref:Recombinase family protein n=1 Tax=Bacillus bingmayongensis TaxID=1150157 RepID=A0ABU5JWW5_9BACI|nr:recombinase family protein [Bacillus pseudomycoides]